MNILITAAATAQAHQLLRTLNTTENVFFADSVELPQIMLKDKKFLKTSPGDSPSYAHLLLTSCMDLQIAKVYPLRKAEIIALSEARQLFDEYGIEVMVPEKSIVPALLDKGIKGKILIKENSEDGLPDRGIFIRDEATLEYQLFTAD